MEIPVRFFLKLCSVAIGLLALASVFVHPYGSVKSQRSDAPLLTGAEAKLEITQIFERSCQNCHSERTEWPWYSYVAPLSWMIEKDVSMGRSHMNLSQGRIFGRSESRTPHQGWRRSEKSRDATAQIP